MSRSTLRNTRTPSVDAQSILRLRACLLIAARGGWVHWLEIWRPNGSREPEKLGRGGERARRADGAGSRKHAYLQIQIAREIHGAGRGNVLRGACKTQSLENNLPIAACECSSGCGKRAHARGWPGFAHGFQQIDVLQLGIGDARIAATSKRRNQTRACAAAGIEREFARSQAGK